MKTTPPMTKNEPTAQAMRTAGWILNAVLPSIPSAKQLPGPSEWQAKKNEIASIIDRETGLPELLEALERVHGYMSGIMVYDHGMMGGTLAGKTPSQVMAAALLASKKGLK
jgi:hypothetical protein